MEKRDNVPMEKGHNGTYSTKRIDALGARMNYFDIIDTAE